MPKTAVKNHFAVYCLLHDEAQPKKYNDRRADAQNETCDVHRKVKREKVHQKDFLKYFHCSHRRSERA